MNILIVTPAKPGSRHGNRNTATRWARHLRMSGHEADTVVDANEATRAHDVMIALHARRSAESIAEVVHSADTHGFVEEIHERVA